ncbi:MAG: PLP-dependent cysteine synthase family protein [Candidatus Hermodarchaeia archaeon]|jgi:cysteine synthase
MTLFIAKNALDLIGNTPMIPVRNLNPNPKVQIYLKLEKFNPGGSVKDRIAKYMIEDAEKRGALTKDKIIIEPTSGNTGIGLALVCAAKNRQLVLVMPESMTKERRQILAAYGAHMILTSAKTGMDGAEDEAHKIVETNPDKYFMPNQFANEANVQAHRETTAEEIWRDTKGSITHFVAGMGTSGTIMGVASALKPRNRNLQLIGVAPHPDTPIAGLKDFTTQYVPKIYRRSWIDDTVQIRLNEAQEAARRLALKEGVFVGPSSGAIFLAAQRLAKTLKSGTIVAIMPDGGERYLSTQSCTIDQCPTCIPHHGIQCILTTPQLSTTKK